MSFHVDTDVFVASHGRNPRGHGYWIFNHGTTTATFEHTGTYTEAKAALRRHTRARGMDDYWILGS